MCAFFRKIFRNSTSSLLLHSSKSVFCLHFFFSPMNTLNDPHHTEFLDDTTVHEEKIPQPLATEERERLQKLLEASAAATLPC